MKIQMTLDGQSSMTSGNIVHHLVDKAAYDALYHSPAGRKRAEEEAKRQRQMGCGCEIYSSDPDRYPCILIEGFMMHNSNGPDKIAATYLYDFTVITEEDERKAKRKDERLVAAIEILQEARDTLQKVVKDYHVTLGVASSTLAQRMDEVGYPENWK